MAGGGRVEVLVQSETSVRGQHVNKLRCDEIELFKPKVYEAAQYTTETTRGWVSAIEVISTKHRAYGLMSKLLTQTGSRGLPVFKWNVWDTMEECQRPCEGCPIACVCEGVGRRCRGYKPVDDVITEFDRTSRRSFNAEMLCDEGKKSAGFRIGCFVRSYL